MPLNTSLTPLCWAYNCHTTSTPTKLSCFRKPTRSRQGLLSLPSKALFSLSDMATNGCVRHIFFIIKNRYRLVWLCSNHEKVFGSASWRSRLWASLWANFLSMTWNKQSFFFLYDCLECSPSRRLENCLIHFYFFDHSCSHVHYFLFECKKRSSLWKFSFFSSLSNGIFRWRWLSIYLLARPFINITVWTLKISSIAEPFFHLMNCFTFLDWSINNQWLIRE